MPEPPPKDAGQTWEHRQHHHISEVFFDRKKHEILSLDHETNDQTRRF